jgi:hypothetical protein
MALLLRKLTLDSQWYLELAAAISFLYRWHNQWRFLPLGHRWNGRGQRGIRHYLDGR